MYKRVIFPSVFLSFLIITRFLKPIIMTVSSSKKCCTLLHFLLTPPFILTIVAGTIQKSYGSAHTLVCGSQFSGTGRENVNCRRASLAVKSLLILPGKFVLK